MTSLTLADKLRYKTILANLAPLGGLFPSLRAKNFAVLASFGIDVDNSYRAFQVEVLVKPPPELLHHLAGMDAPTEAAIAGSWWPGKRSR